MYIFYCVFQLYDICIISEKQMKSIFFCLSMTDCIIYWKYTENIQNFLWCMWYASVGLTDCIIYGKYTEHILKIFKNFYDVCGIFLVTPYTFSIII